METVVTSKKDTRKKESTSKKKRIKTTIIYFILGIFSLVNAYPIVWMVINSFKSESEFIVNQFGFPKVFVLENYINAWNIANLGCFI